MPQYKTNSRKETIALGEAFAKKLPKGALICFNGGLGSGKTAFCEGIALGLACTDPVSSPTYSIVNYYHGSQNFAHFDLYRLSCETDLNSAGFYDYLDGGDIVAVEWSENFAELLAQENPIQINIEKLDENTRVFTIEGFDL